MKKRSILSTIYWFSFCTGLILFISCSSTRVAKVDYAGENIELYFTKKPNVEYKEVCFLETSGSLFTSRQQLLNALVKKAKAQNINALLNIQFQYQFIWPSASAIGIKY